MRNARTLTTLVAIATLLLAGVVPATADEDGANADANGGDANATDEANDDTGPIEIRQRVRDTDRPTPDVQLHGSGWGHGVGMSQYGAYAMALAGHDVAEILTHYYPGTEVTTDTAASDERIRVGIAINQSSSQVRALDGDVAWRICTPSGDLPSDGRVSADDCETWFEQAANERLRVRPLPTDGGGAPTIEDADGEVVLDPDGDDAEPAPAGGLLIEREAGGGWEPVRGYAADAGGPLPIARVEHGDDRIEAQSYASPQRHYAFGWRDLHLAGSADAPDRQSLTVVQDVGSVEAYLRGLAEVPNSWASGALEAQAITGRTFALRAGRGGGCRCDLLATAADQVFIGESKVEDGQGERWAAAVADTQDQVLTYEGELAQTYYSSSHGGRSENIEDSWAYDTDEVPYLRSVDDPWSLESSVGDVTIRNTRRDWTAAADNQAMAGFLSAGRSTPIATVERIAVRSRTDGGTPRELDVVGRTADGQRESFTTDLSATYGKGIAGAAMRRSLELVEGGEDNGRLSSSQIDRFGFEPFVDDDGSIHELAIVWAYDAGIVRGVGGDRFAPTRSVTRGQLASFLVNTFELPVPTPTGRFDDAPVGETHTANIEALVEAGLASGYDDTTFGPGDPVTRAQMASLLAAALDLPSAEHRFGDVDAGSPHADNIAAIAEAGITSGCASDAFCPLDPVQRGQLSTLLLRMVHS